jgi:thiosulfate/3-mercaptopyruvate sulfurtransferase
LTLVSTDLLASHLGGEHADARWAIVDCRFDLQAEHWGREQYERAHIPGAVYASLKDDLAGPRTGTSGRHPLPTPNELTRTLSRFGIGPDTQVVVYDQDSGMYASRLWWLLRYMGHDAVALLDGGWAKWIREGRPTRSGDEQRPAETFVGAPRPLLRAAVDEVAARLADPNMLLIDARGPERYEGRTEPIDRVAGHIPGALNRYYKSNVTDEGTLLPPDTLRQQFADLLAGHEPADVVMYCGSGVTACHNLLAMEHAGLAGARLYPGSWSEWSSDPTRPVEKGPTPK